MATPVDDTQVSSGLSQNHTLPLPDLYDAAYALLALCRGPLMGSGPPTQLSVEQAASSSLHTEPLTTFPQFSRLPIELRHAMWNLSTPESRIVEVRGYVARSKDKKKELRMTSKTLVPAIMHACVDSRAAGTKIYEKLLFKTFTGTYINWVTDFILFQGDAEDLYMTQEGKVNNSSGHSDLVVKCRRFAINYKDFYKFYRVTTDTYDYYSNKYCDKVLIYPSLEELVAVRSITKSKSQNGDTGILTMEPAITMEYTENDNKSLTGKLVVRTIKNYFRQETVLVYGVRGEQRLLTRGEKAEQKASGPSQPKKPTNIQLPFHFTAIDLRRVASFHGLDSQGTKKDLVERLKADDAAKYALAMEKYQEDLGNYAIAMMGYLPLDESAPIEEHQQRKLAVADWLKERGLA